MRLRAAVFASGGGTNFQALLDHQRPDGSWEIVLLLTDRPGVGALARAEEAGVPTAVVPTRGRDLDDVGRQMLVLLEEHAVDVILLAGYLKLVPPAVVTRYPGRILNIHPALLPAFGGKGMYGMNVHRAVIEAGEKESGATVHFVDEEYDRGAILGQRRVTVEPGDTPEDLAARVLAVEHRLYPDAVDHLCDALSAGCDPGPMP
ncbi:MAG: phosphoribosylglycinamide formyltransferase [Gemmatimonadota bacterium]